MIPYLLVHTDFLKREVCAKEITIEAGLSKNHPDVLWFDNEDKIGIEQARQIKDFLSLKPFSGSTKAIIIISAENLSADAQNTLLKTLEEPPGKTVIILGVSSAEQLLPTILSRCQIIDLSTPLDIQNNASSKYEKDIEKLLSLNTEGRFQFIEKLKEREEFLPALTNYFRQKLLEESLGVNTIPPPRWNFKSMQNFLKDLIEAEKWAKSNVNIRGILEYLMLKMPMVEK